MSNWPKEIPISDKIGLNEFYQDDQPCCAVGHLHALGVWSDKRCQPRVFPTRPEGKLYQAIYDKLYRILVPGRYISTVLFYTNDCLNQETRTKLYLLTWAKLGYVKGMPKHILDLLEKPEIKAIEVEGI